jgi:hypothetical protein
VPSRGWERWRPVGAAASASNTAAVPRRAIRAPQPAAPRPTSRSKIARSGVARRIARVSPSHISHIIYTRNESIITRGGKKRIRALSSWPTTASLSSAVQLIAMRKFKCQRVFLPRQREKANNNNMLVARIALAPAEIKSRAPPKSLSRVCQSIKSLLRPCPSRKRFDAWWNFEWNGIISARLGRENKTRSWQHGRKQLLIEWTLVAFRLLCHWHCQIKVCSSR